MSVFAWLSRTMGIFYAKESDTPDQFLTGAEFTSMSKFPLIALIITVLVASFYSSASASDVPSCVVGTDCETGDFGLSAAEIEAYPAPNVTLLAPDDGQIFDRRYRRVTAATEFYDAPNGNVVEGLASGFNFVTITNEENGWARTSSGKWLRSEVLSSEVATSRFSGVFLPDEPLPYPLAWILVHVRPAQTPGGEFTNANPLLLRYTPVSLYSTVEVDGWNWYQIGVDQWVKQTQVAMVKPVERTDDINTERWISVDLYEQVMIAYEGDKPVFATLISSGLSEWPTNEGLFNIYVRFQRTVMAGAYGRPDFYYLQEVPWTMYFDNDIALHGSYWHDGYGYRRSHGCVNLSVMDARWLFNWSTPEFDFDVPEDEGPAVLVYSSGTYR